MTYPVHQSPHGTWQTTYQPARTNHVLHLILTLLTLGFWVPVWLIVALMNHGRTVPVQTWVSLPYSPVPAQLDLNVRPVTWADPMRQLDPGHGA